MGGSSGGGKTNTIEKTDPWAGQQPYLADVFSTAQNMFRSGMPSSGQQPMDGQPFYSGYSDGVRPVSGLPYGSRPATGNVPYVRGSGAIADVVNSAITNNFGFVTPGVGNGGTNYWPEYYPDQTVADLSPYSRAAIDLTASRALNGSPVSDAANSEAQKTLSGGYLGQSNPWLNQTLNGDYLDPTKNSALNAIVDRNAGDITSRVMSQFGAAGRTGSGINQQVLARELGDNANQLYGQAYDNERNRMLSADSLYSKDFGDERARMAQALALAPQTAGMDYTDLSQLGTAGNAVDTQNQNIINANKARWDYTQNLPKDMLDWYSGIVQGNNWGRSSTSTAAAAAPQGNGAMGAAGGAMAGYQMTGSPYGAAVGGILGYLGSR